MIRGLIGVVPYHAMEVGRFYMAPSYRDGAWLFQCIQTSEPFEDGFRRKALFFTTGGAPDLALHELPDQTPVAVLDEAHIRVDPTSLSGAAVNTSLSRGLFIIKDDEAIVCAPTDHFRGWAAINISTGRTVTGSVGSNWLSFSRWSLVMDDEEGDELTLASFSPEE